VTTLNQLLNSVLLILKTLRIYYKQWISSDSLMKQSTISYLPWMLKGLYTNIPNADGLNALKYFLDSRSDQTISTSTLLRLAELVLTVNCFEFDQRYFQQIGGTMIGTPFGVEYACLFMSHQEHLIGEAYDDLKPHVNKRYIDDIFGISSMPTEKLEKYIQFVKNFHPSLEYTVTIAKSVNMLDTTLSVEGTLIKSSLYSKETDKHTYLRYDSSHPKACKDSIPYSQFLRLKKICSDEQDFLCNSKTFQRHFIKQGYPKFIIEKAFLKVRLLDRQEVLYREKVSSNNDRIVFPIAFHPTNQLVCKTIKNNFEMLSEDQELSKVFNKPPMIAYKKDKSLKDLLVRSSISSVNVSDFGMKSCGRKKCITCQFINPTQQIVGGGGSFSIREKFNCLSELRY